MRRCFKPDQCLYSLSHRGIGCARRWQKHRKAVRVGVERIAQGVALEFDHGRAERFPAGEPGAFQDAFSPQLRGDAEPSAAEKKPASQPPMFKDKARSLMGY